MIINTTRAYGCIVTVLIHCPDVGLFEQYTSVTLMASITAHYEYAGEYDYSKTKDFPLKGIPVIDPHTAQMFMSLGGHVTIFSYKTTLKMAADHMIQFSDHVRRHELSTYVINYQTLLWNEIRDLDA